MTSILIVDDSATARHSLRAILEKEGYSCTEAVDGNEGVAKAENNDFELIIADYHMPFLDGVEMVNKLRKGPRHEKTPVIFVTTEGNPSIAQKGKDVGAQAWVIKPYEVPPLVDAVKRAIGAGA